MARPLKINEKLTITSKDPATGATRSRETTRGERVVEILRSGNYREVAARASGITPATLYDYLARGRKDRAESRKSVFSEFLEAVEKAEADSEAEDIAAIKLAGQRDWHARAWLRERKEPEKWALRTRVLIETAVKKEQAEELVQFLAGVLERRVTDPDARIAIINDLLDWSTQRSSVEVGESEQAA